jgi:hypothetical protein
LARRRENDSGELPDAMQRRQPKEIWDVMQSGRINTRPACNSIYLTGQLPKNALGLTGLSTFRVVGNPEVTRDWLSKLTE